MRTSNHLPERPHRLAEALWLVLLTGAWVTIAVVPTPIDIDDPFTVVFAGVRLGAGILAARATVATIAFAVARAARSAAAARLALRSAPRSLRPIVQRQLAIAIAAGSTLVAVPGVAGASTVVAAGDAAPRGSGTAPSLPETAPPAMWRLEESSATSSTGPSPDSHPAPAPTPAEPSPADAATPRPDATTPRSESGAEPDAGDPEATAHRTDPPGDADGSASPADGPAAPPSDRTWVVARGEHLWSIAADVQASRLGRQPTIDEVARLHTAVIELNRNRLADPDNPDLIFAGQELIVPEAP